MTPQWPAGGAGPGRNGHLARRTFLSIAAAASGAGLGAAAVPAGAGEVPAPVPTLAQISVPAGALSVQQRQAMVTGITKVLVDVTGARPAGLPYVTVLVAEAAEGGWGVAGHGHVRSELPGLVADPPLPPGAELDGVR